MIEFKDPEHFLSVLKWAITNGCGDKLLERLEYLASHDPLTGCLNLRGLAQETVKPGYHPSALAYFDLDRFKPINDEFGHDVGDGVLQQVAARMRSALSPAHLLARVGGDEFVAVLAGVAQREQVEALAAEVAAVRKDDLLDRATDHVLAGVLTAVRAQAETDDPTARVERFAGRAGAAESRANGRRQAATAIVGNTARICGAYFS